MSGLSRSYEFSALEYDQKNLEEAITTWRTAYRAEPEQLLIAKSVLRWWRVTLKSQLRGLPRTSETYLRLKPQEEHLEAMILDLHEAWVNQLSARRNGG